jgi:aquaporin Z
MLFPSSQTLGETMPTIPDSSAFTMEVILAFIMVFVILHLAKGSKEQGMFAGIAIGSVVLLEVLFAGPICGASMNPIRSIVPALISGKLEHQWVYLTAPFLGGIIAVYAWKILKRK